MPDLLKYCCSIPFVAAFAIVLMLLDKWGDWIKARNDRLAFEASQEE